MAEVEILHIHDKQYLTYKDTMRYLHCTENTLSLYMVRNQLLLVRIESLRLFEWGAVEAVAELRAKRGNARAG